uniref:Uncharacterized protein n=1 Tax=Theileria annulata TaxID=5874 RepID=A0A3B0N757_THEAN
MLNKMFNFLLFLLVLIIKTSDSYHINLRNIQTIPNLELLGSSYSTITKDANNDKNARKGSNDLKTQGIEEKDVHTGDGKNNVIDVTNLKNSVIDIKMMNKLNNTLEYVHSDNVYIQNYPRCEILNENKIKDEKEEESAIFTKKSMKGNDQVNTKIIFCAKFIIGLNNM